MLARAGADPHTVDVHDLTPATAFLAQYQAAVFFPQVRRHVFRTFHPQARGVTCRIPLDLTRTLHKRQRTMFERVEDELLRYDDSADEQMQQLATCIDSVNQQMTAQQTKRWHTFSMATHPRVGAASAVLRVFRASPLYDARLLRVIWQCYHIAETLPTCQAQVDEMRRTRAQTVLAPE